MENKKQINNFLYITSITIIIFIVTSLILSIIGLTPSSLSVKSEQSEQSEQKITSNELEILDIQSNNYTRPDKIVIPKVGVDTNIEKPNSVDVSVLDSALTKGAVHYPGSGSLEQGNMFIFGHSTNWTVVQNPAYKTFNGIERLISGDEIEIYADGKTYIYKVNSVVLLDDEDALVEFDNSKRTLTISTCNTFGEKQERWVVEAEFDREFK